MPDVIAIAGLTRQRAQGVVDYNYHDVPPPAIPIVARHRDYHGDLDVSAERRKKLLDQIWGFG